MEFCPKCGSVLTPQKKGGRILLVCRKGHTMSAKGVSPKTFKLSVTGPKAKEEIIVVEKKSNFEVLPRTTASCPKCENTEAFWWMQQMRSADEPPTRFFRCTKCSHVWREYE
ncbi:MAG: transcription factor S [Candidatus Aenigmatarchaeota archaeon]